MSILYGIIDRPLDLPSVADWASSLTMSYLRQSGASLFVHDKNMTGILAKFRLTNAKYLVVLEQGTLITNQHIVHDLIESMDHRYLFRGIVERRNGLHFPSTKFMVINGQMIRDTWHEWDECEYEDAPMKECLVPRPELPSVWSSRDIDRPGFNWMLNYMSRSHMVRTLSEQERAQITVLQPGVNTTMLSYLVINPIVSGSTNQLTKDQDKFINELDQLKPLYRTDVFNTQEIRVEYGNSPLFINDRFTDEIKRLNQCNEGKHEVRENYSRESLRSGVSLGNLSSGIFTNSSRMYQNHTFTCRELQVDIGELVTNSSFFTSMEILRDNGFTNKTRVVHLSTSSWHKLLECNFVDYWDGSNLPAYLKTAGKANHGMDCDIDTPILWDYMLAKFGGPKEFKQLWQAYRNLEHHFTTPSYNIPKAILDVIHPVPNSYIHVGRMFCGTTEVVYSNSKERQSNFDALMRKVTSLNTPTTLDGFTPDGQPFTFRS